ncbi:hypothetical protein R1sor_004845 [Riccia sorocarpa]|uniref:Dehydrin n=1 Tax=Riccia sorocarpa TaxID=122646 RepID=A0ABD3HLR6_9MARC
MAHEVHDGSPHREPGYGGNAEGVTGEHQQRPGMGGKVKNTLAHVTAKLMGQKGEQERASNFPGAKFNEDPQMYVGPPSLVYGSTGNGLKLKKEGGDNVHRRSLSPHSPHSAHSSRSHSPRSPRVPLGHNPEDEPIGVGEQGADSVMPGRYGDYPPEHNHCVHAPRSEKLLEKLPGYNQNPYKHYDSFSDGHEYHHHPSPLRDPQRQHVVGEPGTEEFGEDHAEQGEKRPGIIGKLKDLVTGQKPGQGAGTGHATADQVAGRKEENVGKKSDLPDGTHGYVTAPSPMERGSRLRDAESNEAWPSPAEPGHKHVPGAVRTDGRGKPIEGPKEEGKSPKSEGVMSKIMEKFHIGEQKPPSDQKPTSPKTAPRDHH